MADSFSVIHKTNLENAVRILLVFSIFLCFPSFNMREGKTISSVDPTPPPTQAAKPSQSAEQAEKDSVPDSQDGVGGLAVPMNDVREDDNSGAAQQTDGVADDDDGLRLPEDLTRVKPLLCDEYYVKKGDNISTLAMSFGLDESTFYSANNIQHAKDLRYGTILYIPNEDGVFYTVKKGDTLDSIAKRYADYGVSTGAIATANELYANFALPSQKLFIPGAKMDDFEKRERAGDLFSWPLVGYRRISSPFGRRWNPYGGGSHEFHAGMDIAAPNGTPVYAPMPGKVIQTGRAGGSSYNSRIYGNYIMVRHNSTYTTLYGHLSRIRVSVGQFVGTGTLLGNVGSTGRSTGHHLHFQVYKNGVVVNPWPLMGR
jgi:murein DD-endopeptidase MepM/ murein hydrolase activator NlpD